MNPRKVGAPARETRIIDDDPLQMFLPESPEIGTAEGTAPLDVGELELRQSPAEETTLWTTRRRRRRSILRSVPGVVGVVILLALIVAAAVRNRWDVSALSDRSEERRVGKACREGG